MITRIFPGCGWAAMVVTEKTKLNAAKAVYGHNRIKRDKPCRREGFAWIIVKVPVEREREIIEENWPWESVVFGASRYHPV
jgi:hypothetical protein